MTQPEKSFLESLMHRPDLWHSMAVRPKHLSSGVGIQVYEAIGRAVKDGLAVVSVADLRALDAKIPLTVIADLQPFTSALWERHQEGVIDEAGRRALAKVPNYLRDVLEEKSASGAYYSLLSQLSEHFSDEGGTWYGQLRDSLDIDGLREQMERYRKGELPGIPSGHEKLDGHTSGFQKGMVYVIGALPSQGKSALIADISMNVALMGYKPGVITIESSRRELARRLLARQSGVDLDRIVKGSFSDAEIAGPLLKAVDDFTRSDFIIYDKPNSNMKELQIVGQRMKQADGVNIIFIDYLQNVQAMNKRLDRKDQVAEISRDIKNMARELDIPIVVGAQLTREYEKAGKAFPKISDLGESSQIEKDADCILLLHHEPGTDGRMWFCVAKMRDGQKGVIKARFDGAHMRFIETEWSDIRIGDKPDF